jgi:hypothetical protein
MTEYRLITNGFRYSIQYLGKKYIFFREPKWLNYTYYPYYMGLNERFYGTKLECEDHIKKLLDYESERNAKWSVV